jgi:GNAT superfamily N-acetyltransferase
VADAEGFVVRRSGEEDVPAAVGLFEALDRFQSPWRVFHPRPDLAGEAEARYRAALDPAGPRLHVVAEREGRLMGMALGHALVPSSMSEELAVEVSNVIVLPEARGRGVGRALVAEIARWAVEGGARLLTIKTYSNNGEALRFWEGLGFRPRLVQMTLPAEDLAGPER